MPPVYPQLLSDRHFAVILPIHNFKHIILVSKVYIFDGVCRGSAGFIHMQGALQRTKNCEPLTGRVLRWRRRLEGLGEPIMTSETQHISISNTSHRGMFWLGPLQTIPPWERVAATKEENNISVFAFQSSHFSPTELILWERNLRATVSVPVIRVRPFWIYQAPCGACCFFEPN